MCAGWGWGVRGVEGDGVMVLGKLPVPGRPTNMDDGKARAYCACGLGLLWTLFTFAYHFSFISPSLWETAKYRLKYYIKWPLSPNQPTNNFSEGVIFLSLYCSYLRNWTTEAFKTNWLLFKKD